MQDGWESANFTAFANDSGTTDDQSFISVLDKDNAVIGTGGASGVSDINQFDPDNTGSTFTDTLDTNIQNYSGVFRGSDSIFVAGANGQSYTPWWGGTAYSNTISHVTLDGTSRTLIDNVSGTSGGIATSNGDLYVADADDGRIYRFLDSAIETAIANNEELSMLNDGETIAQFDASNTGSIAVDGNGTIWAAGYGTNGIQSYNPDTKISGHFVPGYDNKNYKVGAFSRNGVDYVAFINNEGWSAESSVTYGYATVDAVPEPQSVLLLMVGTAAMLIRRIKRRIGLELCG